MKHTYLILMLAACTQAATLTNVIVSTSFPGPTITNTPLYRVYGNWQPVSSSGVFTDFDGSQLHNSHFGGVAAVQTSVDAPSVGLFFNTTYQLGFTILDPANNGYSVDLGHTIVGFLNAAYDADNSTPGSSVAARYQGITVDFLNANNDWIPISNLELTTTGLTRADEDEPLLSRFLLDGASANAFALSGTRDFQFRFNFHMQVAAGEGAAGEAAIRLGLDPCTAIPSFVDACTPGLDGMSLEQLGHFVTVRVYSFGGPINNEVPEPATLLTSAAAILLAIGLKYRK